MEEVVQKLQEDVRELSLGTSTRVERLDGPPSPLRFLRDYVSPNKPCIISNAIQHWPALTTWTHNDHYLSQKLSRSIVSVHLTPDGQADALVPSPTTTSATTTTTSPSSLLCICPHPTHAIPRKPFDLSLQVPRIHLWLMLRSRMIVFALNIHLYPQMESSINHLLSQRSLRNLYAVITGEKHFLLLPPTDVHRLYIRNYPAACYSLSQDTGELTLQLEQPRRHVPWCSVNPYPPAATKDQEVSKFPLYFNGPRPFECTVKAGEILYLPSMWFHHVKQSPDNRGRTIAINYWYDMQFDIKYAYFNMWQTIRSPLSSNTLAVLEKNSDAIINE
ncbi:hypothetical protein MKW92_014750 [Papaver armeniacum]|nr:hypothetical protein MKW92_014750 [Papaver armeniacum]